MNYLKIGGGILGAIALLVVIGAFRDRARLAAEVRGYEACTSAVQRPAGDLTACKGPVQAVTEEARRARTCETALGQGDAGLYAVRASCGENAKRQGAELTAARAELSDTRRQLSEERAGRAAAVSRAEARSTAQEQRRASQDETIRNQPRAPDGRIRCDAECLRRLGGDASAAGAGPGR